MKAIAITVNNFAAGTLSRLGLLSELVKARLTLLVLVTTGVGFALGASGPILGAALVHVLVGTALLAGGAATLNQWIERDLDARMRRTRDRPLPAGRIDPGAALGVGVTAVALGVGYLAVMSQPLAAVVGAVTAAVYLLVYTPLKTRSSFNTIVGAVPGALPPVIGWAAARGDLSRGAWALFAIQFFWQVPHFLAIAWLYRDEYAGAGFRMLPAVDPAGRRTAVHMVSHAVALTVASLAPVAFGLCGRLYAVGALGLGMGFVALALRFASRRDDRAARGVFLASIIYLPILLGLMIWDKVD